VCSGAQPPGRAVHRVLGSHAENAGAADAPAAQGYNGQGCDGQMAPPLLDATKLFRQRELTGLWPVFTSGG